MVRERKSLEEKSMLVGGAVLRARSAEWVLRFDRREAITWSKGWDFILNKVILKLLFSIGRVEKLRKKEREVLCTFDISPVLRSYGSGKSR